MSGRFIYPLRVYIEDTDGMGVVFHANYIKFMERARSEWMLQLGLGGDWQQKEGICFLAHTLNIQFLKPAKLHQQVEVVSTVKKLQHTSIVFQQYLRLADAPDKILSKMEIKLACVNAQLRPKAIPLSFIEKLREFT